MRVSCAFVLGSIAAVAAAGSAHAATPTEQPPSSPASSPLPMSAASKMLPARNPALVAAENAKEPGVQRPEERVIPQISVPLKSRKDSAAAALRASAPVGSSPGAVNDAAARCMAAPAKDKAACERRLAASAPTTTGR